MDNVSVNEQHLGKYRIEKRLGSGTFAEVYRCFDPDLEITCAVKVLAERWSQDDRARSWFLNEARVMSGINHPAIVRILTAGNLDDGRPYFVMEYASQGSLRGLIQARHKADESFEIREALDISIGVADGLAAAHSRGLVHQDLKPSNVLLQEMPVPAAGPGARERTGRQVKLTDFGLARRLADAVSDRAEVERLHYGAPEQAEGQPNDFPDLRSDIYSAAAILYEMLAGQPLVRDGAGDESGNVSPPEELTDLAELAPHVPREIVDLVHAGLESDPDKRIQDATAWRDQLQVLRAALNPDGTYTRWMNVAPAVPSPERLAHLRRPAEDQQSTRSIPVDDAAIDESRSSEATWLDHLSRGEIVDRELYEPTGPPRRPNRMRGYVVGSLVAGLVIVALLGFALADLMDGDRGIRSDDIVSSPSSNVEQPHDDPERPSRGSESAASDIADIDANSEPEPTSTPEVEEPEPTPTPEPTPEPDEAVEEVADLLGSLPGTASSIVILPAGDRIEDQPDRRTAAGSTITLWIAAAVLDEIDRGSVSLDDEHMITSDDQVPGTGFLNSSQYLNSTITVEELLDAMIRSSDNSAANILVELIGGRERVNEYADDHDYPETRLQRNLGIMNPEQENYTSARDSALFFERLLNDEIVDPESSERIRELLTARAEDETLALDYFGRGLPTDVGFANLSGFIPGVRNETGYFYSESRDGVVIASFMISDLEDGAEVEEPIARLVAQIHGVLEAPDRDIATISH